MAASEDKHPDYLIHRFREISGSASRWALVFLAALTYAWLSSIFPRAETLDNYVTAVNTYKYFNRLGARAQKAKNAYLDTLWVNYYQSVDSHSEDTGFLKSAEKELNREREKVGRYKKDPDTLKQLMAQVGKVKGTKRKKLKDSIHESYLAPDIVLALAELKKSDAEAQRDSIRNKINVTFDVPGLHTLSFGFRLGLIVWMLLNLILVLYLFSTRLSLIRYLKQIYEIKRKTCKGNLQEWRKIDLNVPHWMAPLVVKKSPEEQAFRSLVGWRFYYLNNGLGLGLLLLTFLMQVYVAWLGWHVAVILDERDTWLLASCLLLVASFLFVLLLWLQPVSLSPQFSQSEAFSFQRREFLKLGASGLLFFLLLPSVGKAIPMMKGKVLGYRRVKERKKKSCEVAMADGLYVRHRKKRLATVYFFHKGISPSMKHLSEEKLGEMTKQLKKIELLKAIDDNSLRSYSIPFASFVLEMEAYQYALKNDYFAAIKILTFAVTDPAETTTVMRSETPPSQFPKLYQEYQRSKVLRRLQSFLSGLILRAEKRLPPGAFDVIWGNVSFRITYVYPDAVTIAQLVKKQRRERILRKWQDTGPLPWQLPERLPWS